MKRIGLLSLKHFPNKPWFLHVSSASLLKTLREKEKLLITSNFSFSLSVFYQFGELSAIFIKLEIVVCKLLSVWKSLKFGVGERVNSIQLVPILNVPEKRSLFKTWEKENMLVTSIFFFSQNVFYPIQNKFYLFSHI